MLAAFLTATARHRRLILGIAVVLGVGWPAVQPLVRSADPVSGQHLLEGQFAIVVAMALLAIVSWSRPVRPAAFAVDPQVPTFRTFPEATQVFVALLFIGMSSAQVAMFFPIQGNGAPSEDPDRRGIGVDRRLLSIGNVHPWFIADAIRYYATYPEHRAAIGTQAEYERLVATLNGPGPA